jgi:aspartokinase
MALIVQKYGGTSVGSIDRIRNVAARMKRTRDEGNRVAAVVSAMGGVTDKLIGMAEELCDDPAERELDVLLATGEQQSIALVSMALHGLGVDAASITGRQAGIFTTGSHTRGRISNMDPSLMNRFLEEGKTLVVAGFQGITLDGMVHTLGRGGSDLTAIAVAAALKADVCQILTDVDGVYTCDPRVVKNARKLPEISYDEMLEMASSGSKVMQSRSVEFAKKFGVIFEVRNEIRHVHKTVWIIADIVVTGQLRLPIRRQQLEAIPAAFAPGIRYLATLEYHVRHIVLRQQVACSKAGMASTNDDDVSGAGEPCAYLSITNHLLTTTFTFVGFVMMSNTAERFCDCATSAAMSSSDASASIW